MSEHAAAHRTSATMRSSSAGCRDGYRAGGGDPPFPLELAHYEARAGPCRWPGGALSRRCRRPSRGRHWPGLLAYRWPVHRLGPSYRLMEPPAELTLPAGLCDPASRLPAPVAIFAYRSRAAPEREGEVPWYRCRCCARVGWKLRPERRREYFETPRLAGGLARPGHPRWVKRRTKTKVTNPGTRSR